MRKIATRIAHHTRPIHQVIHGLVRMTVHPKRHRSAHEVIEVARKARVVAGSLVLRMETSAEPWNGDR